MIIITQGHEQSVSLEIYLKCLFLFSKQQLSTLKLICFEHELIKNLNYLNIKATKTSADTYRMGKININCSFIDKDQNSLPQTSLSLLKALDILKKNNYQDILLTLPSSKDQFQNLNQPFNGHTHFLRHYLDLPNLSMCFSSEYMHILLLTDHIPLKNVPDVITEKLIIEKIQITIDNYNKYFFPLDEVYFAGINPHAGEGDSSTKEDKKIKDALIYLQKIYPTIKFFGPLSGDSLHFLQNNRKRQLFVYMHHDQGLGVFKGLSGLYGTHMTLGAPFLRLSVDHGTAFDLYGKNLANPLGLYFTLKKALQIQKC